MEKPIIAVYVEKENQWFMVEYDDHTKSQPYFWDKQTACDFVMNTTPAVRSALCWALFCAPNTWARV